jgi:hypothetical protein
VSFGSQYRQALITLPSAASVFLPKLFVFHDVLSYQASLDTGNTMVASPG